VGQGEVGFAGGLVALKRDAVHDAEDAGELAVGAGAVFPVAEIEREGGRAAFDEGAALEIDADEILADLFDALAGAVGGVPAGGEDLDGGLHELGAEIVEGGEGGELGGGEGLVGGLLEGAGVHAEGVF